MELDRQRKPISAPMDISADATAPLKTIVIPPVEPASHSATVFLLHGSGGSGENWLGHVATFRKDPGLRHIKWILPSAPRRLFGNVIITPCWFSRDTENFEIVDEKGIDESNTSLTQLIEAEIDSGTAPNRIVLAGFSQGGAMTLVIGLTYAKKLAGLVVLAGSLPIQDKIKERLSSHATSLPIFWGHGDIDPLVKIRYAEQSMEFMQSVGVKIARDSEVTGMEGLTFKMYKDLLHILVDEEIEDVRTWLKLVIPFV